MNATEITTFNTGRKYTNEGQRIAWSVIGRKRDDILDEQDWCHVSFADCDRGIDGTVNVLTDRDAMPTNADVLKGYDNGGYGWDDDRERVAELYKEARLLKAR